MLNTLNSAGEKVSARSLTTSAELEAIISKVMTLRDYIAGQAQFEAKVKEILDLPEESSKLEVEILINNVKQQRLEA